MTSRRYDRPGPATRMCKNHPEVPAVAGRDVCTNCAQWAEHGKAIEKEQKKAESAKAKP